MEWLGKVGDEEHTTIKKRTIQLYLRRTLLRNDSIAYIEECTFARNTAWKEYVNH